MPTLLRLPAEVTDEIISHIQDSRSLSSCALVCRSWTAASLHRLYASIEIRSPRAYELLVTNVLRSPDMHWRLSGVHAVAFGGKAVKASSLPPWDFVVQFAGHLPSLHLLALHSFITPSAPHRGVFAALSSFSSVRELRLEKCHFASFGTLRRILISLPSLHALQLRRVGWFQPSGSQGLAAALDFPERRPRLASLAIDANFESHRTLLPWLLRTPTRDALRELSVTDPAKFSVAEDLWKPFQLLFFETVAASVTTLFMIPEINFPMEAFTSLKRLSFYLQAHGNGPTWNWERTCDVLRRVPSPLTHVHFEGVPVEVVELPIIRTTVPGDVAGLEATDDLAESPVHGGVFVDNRFRYDEWHALDVALADLRSLESVSFALTRAPASKAGRMVVSRRRVVGDVRDVFPALRIRPVRITVTPEYFLKDDVYGVI